MSRILYIEDEPLIADLVKRKLERKGYSVTLVRNGTEADASIAAAPPDLILLDIGLGQAGPDGWEIQQRLSGDLATRRIPVIAVTAQSPTDEDRNRALRVGFADHVPKPIDFAALLAAIESALTRQGGS